MHISIVICTYNRSESLAVALDGAVKQQVADASYEIIVVDNNSCDGTREVVGEFQQRGYDNIRYVFEAKQGISHARNAGIRASVAPIVAFTDDDCCPRSDWVQSILDVLDRHPDISFAGGKITPVWPFSPAPWLLERRHWGPLALTDYGDQEFYADANNPVCLITANLAMRREIFTTIGLFNPRQARGEDHEMQIRAWHAGLRGLYTPQLQVTSRIQPERMTRRYHRRWHSIHGKEAARMRLREGGPSPLPVKTELFGVPGYLYRDVGRHMLGWVSNMLRLRASQAFEHENAIRDLNSYIRARFREKSLVPFVIDKEDVRFSADPLRVAHNSQSTGDSSHPNPDHPPP